MVITYGIVKNVLNSFVPLLQPPPQIYDKQLDEREHTIEEWKGAHSSEWGGEAPSHVRLCNSSGSKNQIQPFELLLDNENIA